MDNSLDDLLQQYDIGQIYDYKKINSGLDKTFKINSHKGKFILKIFQNKLNTEKWEPYVLKRLRQNGLPVSEILRNKSGKYISEQNGNKFHLQKYIAGECCKNYTISQELLNCSARHLAKINIALNDMSLPDSKVCNLNFNENKYYKIKENYLATINKIKTDLIFDSEYSKILNCLKYRLDLLDNKYSELVYGLEALSLKNSHGDYSFRQILLKNKNIEGIIDFSRTSNVPISWELIRSYTISSLECKDAIIDFDKFNKYIRSYENISRLTKFDKMYIPNIYILQLISSLFGLNEYIAYMDIPFLKLFYWRTELVKFLIENMKNFYIGGES